MNEYGRYEPHPTPNTRTHTHTSKIRKLLFAPLSAELDRVFNAVKSEQEILHLGLVSGKKS